MEESKMGDTSPRMLYHQIKENSGDWLDGVINRISHLQYSFEAPSENLPNGINILNKNAMVLKEEQLGKVIASFIVNSYIDVPIVKEEDGITIRFKSPVNIFLEELDHDFTSVINKEGIESIKTILNHPHFQDCHSIDDIESRIPTVDNLLDRFQKD